MKNLLPAIAFTALTLGASPLAAQITPECDLDTVTRFPLVREFITAIDEGDYTTAADAFFLKRPISQEDVIGTARAFENSLENVRVQMCRVLQHTELSPDFRTDVLAVAVGENTLYIFAAGIRAETDWQIVKIRVMTRFEEAFDYLR